LWITLWTTLCITLERIRNDASRPPWREVTRQRRRRPFRPGRTLRENWYSVRRTWRSSKSVASPVHRRIHRRPRTSSTSGLQASVNPFCHVCRAIPDRAMPALGRTARASSASPRRTCLASSHPNMRDQACLALPCPSGPGPSSSRRGPTDHACLALCFRYAPSHVRPFRVAQRLTQPKPVARCQSGPGLPCPAMSSLTGPCRYTPAMPDVAMAHRLWPWLPAHRRT
jgi:hypothetical protein